MPNIPVSGTWGNFPPKQEYEDLHVVSLREIEKLSTFLVTLVHDECKC